jgi:hypothetical protein
MCFYILDSMDSTESSSDLPIWGKNKNLIVCWYILVIILIILWLSDVISFGQLLGHTIIGYILSYLSIKVADKIYPNGYTEQRDVRVYSS